MDAFLISVAAIFVGEIGDKTQLLAILLAARYKKATPIILGMLVATLFNHALAAMLGHWVATHIPALWLRWILGVSFLAIAIWTLKPDEMDEDAPTNPGYGVFLITVVTFFLAEIGDKTQIATMALAAKFSNLYLVVAGSTVGMMLADVPAVLLAKAASPKFPFKWLRIGAASIYAALGVAVLAGLGF